MRSALLAAFILTCVAGCSSDPHPPSVLARYQRLSPDFARLDAADRALARDTGRLSVAMAHSNGPEIGKSAKRVRRDALRLRSATGPLLADLRALHPKGLRTVVRHYLALVRESVQARFWETGPLVAVSHTLQADPYLVDTRSTRAARNQYWSARKSAFRAQKSARIAANLLSHHRAAFRYRA